jgi:hypothetical protein
VAHRWLESHRAISSYRHWCQWVMQYGSIRSGREVTVFRNLISAAKCCNRMQRHRRRWKVTDCVVCESVHHFMFRFSTSQLKK